MQVLAYLFLCIAVVMADDDKKQSRALLVQKYIKNVGETAAASFIDVFRTRARAWGLLNQQQFADLDNDFDFFYRKTGINVTSGFQVGPGIYATQDWTYIPFEVESDQLEDKVVADSAKEVNEGKERVIIDAGNMLIFLRDGTFTGGDWAGLHFVKDGGLISEYVAIVKNVTRSQWSIKANHKLHRCRTELEPAIQVLNVWGQKNSIIVKSCKSVDDGATSTVIVTNVYTNTSATTRDERKTHAWWWD